MDDSSVGGVPVYTDPTTQGVHSGSTVLAMLGLTCVLCIIGVAVWFVAARRSGVYRLVGGERCGDIWAVNVLKEHGVVEWVHSWWDISVFLKISHRHGVDTGVYLLLMKLLTILTGAVACVSLLVFTPLHFFSATGEDFFYANTTRETTDHYFKATTVQSVEQTPYLLLFHVVGIFFNTLLGLYFVSKFAEIVKNFVIADQKLVASTLRIVNIPPQGVTEADVRSYFDTICPGGVESVHFAYDVRKRIVMEGKKSTTRAEIEEWWCSRSKDVKNFGHVTFSSMVWAGIAFRQRKITVPPMNARLQIERAHHPSDITWSHVGRPRTVYNIATNITLTLALTFFSTPTAIYATIEQATWNVSWLRPFFTSSATDRSILLHYLPVLTYLVLTLSPPLLIEYVTRVQPKISAFKTRQLILARVFTYLILCTFVLPAIALSTISAVSGIQQDSFKHAFLPNAGAFFVNLLQVYGTVGNLYELWRPYELFVYWYKGGVGSGWAVDFEFSWQYAVVLSAYGIGVNFAVFSPAAGLMLFLLVGVKTAVHSHHAQSYVYTRHNTLDAHHFGRLIRTVVGLVYLCLALSVSFAICFFTFRDDRASFTVHLLLLACLLGYVLYQGVTAIARHPHSFSPQDYLLSRDSPLPTSSSLDDDDIQLVTTDDLSALHTPHVPTTPPPSPDTYPPFSLPPATSDSYAPPFTLHPPTDDDVELPTLDNEPPGETV